MTPFMLRVAELVDGDPDRDEAPPRPALRESRPKPIPVGADEQVALRALAEQLVAEANAVLADVAAHRIHLDDLLVDGQLGFSLRYGERGALVRTRFGEHEAIGQLQGIGGPCSRLVELAGIDELQNLILLILTGAPAHPSNGEN
jgi:hypothetical protein